MDAGAPGVVRVGAVLAVATPFLILVHELGHAIVPLLRAPGPVSISVGKRPGWLRGRLGRLRFEVSPLPTPRHELPGFALARGLVEPRTEIGFALAGPAANIAVGVLLLMLAKWSGGGLASVLAIAAAVSLIIAVVNLVPHRHGKHRSDGLKALDAYRRLRARPEDPEDLEQTWKRCRDLLLEPGDRLQTEARARALHAATAMEGIERDPVMTTAERIWRAAWAGWCWREVDMALGDPDLAARLALDRALSRGQDPTATTVIAASQLAQSSWNPGGGDRVERVTRRILSMLKGDGSDHAQLRLAFRYGLALHDIERLHRSV
jgi:hypothetical protein